MARQRTPEGPPPEPAVQKLRVRYAKRGRLRFSSTRDFQRALERALRRAGVPMAYSGGFHPHPKISYANAAPTGTASEAEFFEISLTRRVDPAAVAAALDQALPPGIDILEAVEAEPGALADRLQGSVWQLTFRDLDDAAAAEVDRALAALLAADVAEVTRMTKTGPRTFDTRSAVVRAATTDGGRQVELVLRHTTPAVRPDDVLNAMRTLAPSLPVDPPLTVRIVQGLLDEDSAEVRDPLA
ncbi:TIGR03936 family radical SAM-associated protein [Arsenicicoccus piscis]|nr:TIGR03936 family radical SAM-associated protein [Arsenicicoccus piscis]MCH8627221.1 TIGR03936 family radical SAM-associated protein [Arsenicicoccus piscis]